MRGENPTDAFDVEKMAAPGGDAIYHFEAKSIARGRMGRSPKTPGGSFDGNGGDKAGEVHHKRSSMGPELGRSTPIALGAITDKVEVCV